MRELHEKLHANDVIHGDIKANNLIINVVNDCYVVTFIDFGCAYEAKSYYEDFYPLKLVVKSNYAAPERCAEQPLVCGKPCQDIYSLGCLIRRVFPDVFKFEIGDVIRQCMHPDPEQRPSLPSLITLLDDAVKYPEKIKDEISQINQLHDHARIPTR